MSAYADFFIRHGDEFIPVGDFSRNSIIYSLVNDYAPWEKITPLTVDMLSNLVNKAEAKKQDALRMVRVEKERIERVKDFNNSIEDKLEVIHGYEEAIDEWQQDAKEARYAKHYFGFLIDLIDAVRYGEHNKGVNINEYVYVGIEIGYPTVEDISKYEGQSSDTICDNLCN